MSWLVGVDAGGTSNRALALNLETGERRTARGEGANWTVHGPAFCAERIGKSVAEALAGETPAAIAVCMAGYYPPDHAEAAAAWAAETWPATQHRVITNDVHAAWAGAFGGEPGIVVISGTGSIAYGRNAAGEEARAGGWGPLFDDRGSAYDVGVLTLQGMASAVDEGFTVREALHLRIRERWPELGSDMRSWLRGVYRHNWGREQLAAIAAEVAAAADEGDEGAENLIRQAALSLVGIAGTVRARLESNHEALLPVALLGGLGEGCATLRTRFAKQVSILDRAETHFPGRYRILLVDSQFSALQGAVLIAAEALGGRDLLLQAVEALRE